MRHLYVRIYVTLLFVVFLCVLFAGLLAHWLFDSSPANQATMAPLVRLVADQLPDDFEASARLQNAVEALSERLNVDLSLWSAQGEPLAAAGRPMLDTDESPTHRRWLWSHRSVGLVSQLDDGRWMGIVAPQPPKKGGQHLALLAVIFAVMALGSYPLARQITRRLESLKEGVEGWGAGDLSARVEVSGSDEVADLAESFNRAAGRIEALVEQQKRVLLHASHELRSPLTRLRMAVELVADEGGDSKRLGLLGEAVDDIEELDELIGEILLAARLESADQPLSTARVDVLALIEQEARRVGATVSGESATLSGDEGLLRRMIRNLLENARRYSDDVEARLERREGGVRVIVTDRGPGISEAERERVFEPFYRTTGHRETTDGGVGLGLALVRWIAERHGGTVECRSTVGQGTRFIVEL